MRYRSLPPELGQYMDTWDNSFRDWGDKVEPGADGWFRFRAAETALIAPKGPRFKGRVAVLVDGSNHSATLRFAMLVKRHRLATLVGAETGGSQGGINGGAFFFVRLPQTGLEVDLPLIGYFSRERADGAGVAPDIPVATERADYIADVDRVLQRAVGAILSQRFQR